MCRHAAEFRCGPVVSRVPDVDADGRPALDVDLGRMTRCDRTRAAWTIGDRFGMRMFPPSRTSDLYHGRRRSTRRRRPRRATALVTYLYRRPVCYPFIHMNLSNRHDPTPIEQGGSSGLEEQRRSLRDPLPEVSIFRAAVTQRLKAGALGQKVASSILTMRELTEQFLT
ncbi:hypothetical protein EVAR_23933_1 [Eumeta japonica]|uniref:Uncharacterized protein n=1 Tax=Eumeta variegata TaxID=151549 RepID=A0A4C1V2M9_EUMVA|nr:hypothetical protein EVAR_23933_1 [Eumeta japonica]